MLASLRAQYLPDAVLIVNDGVVTWASANVADLLAWDPQEVVGTQLDALMHPDDQEAVRTACRAARAGEEAALAVQARRGEGAHTPVDLLLSPGQRAGDTGDTVVAAIRPIGRILTERHALQALEDAPRRLADRAGDVFFVMDGPGVVLDVGAAAYEMLGWLPEDLIGLQLQLLVHPDDLKRIDDYRRAVRADTATGSVQVRVRTRGGIFRWVSATAVLTRDGGDDPAATRVLVAWRDIDSLVRNTRFAERDLARLRKIMDTALDPWMVLGPLRDERGHVTDFVIEDVNAGAAEYLRWPRERLLGARLLEEFPNVVEHGLMAAYLEALESGETVTIHDLAYPHEIFDESRLYELRAQAEGGSLMITWRDTTPASLARNDLAQGEAMFRRAAGAAGDALVVVLDGAVTWASPGAAGMGLAVDADFEGVMSGVVVPDATASVRACCLLAASGHDYTGRWHRPKDPPLVVRSRPGPGEGAPWIVTMIEERWTEPDGGPGG